MRVNPTLALLSTLVAFLLGYASFVFSINEYRWLFVISGSLVFQIYLLSAFSLSMQDVRKTINIRAVSTIFILLHLVIMLFYAGANHSKHTYIIVSSFLLILFLAIIYSITRKHS
jgi:hypothetical protein